MRNTETSSINLFALNLYLENRCNVLISGDTILIPTSMISSYHVEYIEEKMIGIMTWILENNGFILEAIVMGAIIVYIGRKI